MLNNCHDIFLNLGAKNVDVVLQPIQPDLVNGINPDMVAGALGYRSDMEVTTENINIEGPIPTGFILVNRHYKDLFSDSEWKFILAHECAHIYRNHIFNDHIKQLFNEIANNSWRKQSIMNMINFMSKVREPSSISQDLISNQEYEADLLAVEITKDLSSAISCINRLASSNLINYWDISTFPFHSLPVLERIMNLQRIGMH